MWKRDRGVILCRHIPLHRVGRFLDVFFLQSRFHHWKTFSQCFFSECHLSDLILWQTFWLLGMSKSQLRMQQTFQEHIIKKNNHCVMNSYTLTLINHKSWLQSSPGQFLARYNVCKASLLEGSSLAWRHSVSLQLPPRNSVTSQHPTIFGFSLSVSSPAMETAVLKEMDRVLGQKVWVWGWRHQIQKQQGLTNGSKQILTGSVDTGNKIL